MAENKLTDKHLRNLKPANAEQTIGDGGGLWIRVLPAANGGAINFYYRYTFNGKERRYNCGTYPDTSLSQARNRRNEARKLVKSGIDPTHHEETAKATGMTATGIKASRLKEIPVPFPPLAEQHRIVAKVDELMALCDHIKADLAESRTRQDRLATTLIDAALMAA